MEQVRLLRLRDVLARRARSRSAHYADIAAGLMTRPVKIGKRAAATPEAEIDAVNAARVRGADDDAIRELVRQLHAARQR